MTTQSSLQNKFKDNLLSHFGGEIDYEMTMIDFNERVTLDSELRRCFEGFSVASFNRFLQELLDLAFLDQTNEEEGMRDRKWRVYRWITQCDLNEWHFDRMKMHFVESLRHSWVNSDAIEIASNHLEDIRYLFAHHSFKVSSPPKTIVVDHTALSSSTTRSAGHSLAGKSSKTFGQQYRLQK